MKNSKLYLWAAADAIGVAIYTSLVAWIMFNAKDIFGEVKNFAAPLIILLLFILSAVTTGSLVLGRPIYLFVNGLKNEAVKLLAVTILFLFLILVSVLLLAIKM
jgi:hypothetical protein